jgi:hypothetical protein
MPRWCSHVCNSRHFLTLRGCLNLILASKKKEQLVMRSIKLVRIACDHCGTGLPPPIVITDKAVLEEFIDWGGVDCVKCIRFVEITWTSVPFEDHHEFRWPK